MKAIGIAEAFYGEMYGNEGYLTDQNLAVRKADGALWVATYKSDLDGTLVPDYHIKASARDQDYLSLLKHPVEIYEPSILITYGEKFTDMLTAVEDFPELLEQLLANDEVCEDRYKGFRGYIGTYGELKGLQQEISTAMEKKLYAFFEAGDLSVFPAHLRFYELWKSVTSGYFSETKKMALDTACRVLKEPERKEELLSYAQIHCKHNEGANYKEFLGLLNGYLRVS
jgi:hypothetical protein